KRSLTERACAGRRIPQEGGPTHCVNPGKIGRHPDVAADLGGIGKEEKSTTRERRVEKVHPGATKDFLGKDNGKGNPQGHLPEGDCGRQNEWKEKHRHEEAL